MSTGPLSFIGSMAGTPLAQAKGSEVARMQLEAARQARQTESAQQAKDAAGVGRTGEDEQLSDRDADGRRPWEIDFDGKRQSVSADGSPQPIHDPAGQSGQQLDLRG